MEAGHGIHQAVILVGGLGTRLGFLTEDTPKPLLPVGNRPFLEHVLARCRFHGLTDVLLLAGHLPSRIEAFVFEMRDRYPELSIETSFELAPLGTAGALRYAADRLDNIFYLLNGDSLFDFDWHALAGVLRPQDLGAIALRTFNGLSRYGRVDIDGLRIIGFREKPAEPGCFLINGGVYVLRRSIVSKISEGMGDLEREVFPILAADGLLSGLSFAGEFIDIGVPDDYARAQICVPEWTSRYMEVVSFSGKGRT